MELHKGTEFEGNKDMIMICHGNVPEDAEYVRQLAEGTADMELVRHRAKNEFARVYGMLCGGVSSQFRAPLMNMVRKASDLNGCTDELPVDVTAKIMPYLEGRGIKSGQLVPYRQACREGWAPVPTNEVQRAIWEEVNSAKEQGPVNRKEIKKQF